MMNTFIGRGLTFFIVFGLLFVNLSTTHLQAMYVVDSSALGLRDEIGTVEYKTFEFKPNEKISEMLKMINESLNNFIIPSLDIVIRSDERGMYFEVFSDAAWSILSHEFRRMELEIIEHIPGLEYILVQCCQFNLKIV